MGRPSGTLVTWLAAAGACWVGGPLWGAIAFLGTALLRVTMEAQSLRVHAEALEQCLAEQFESEPEASPMSGVRPRTGAVTAARATSEA